MAIVQFNFPTRINSGVGALSVLPQAIRDEGKSRPIIVTDKALAALPPIAKAEAVLKEAGFTVATYSGVWGNPLVSQVTAGVEAFKAHKADCVVAIGGGAALDVAKGVALLANHSGDLMEYEAFLPKPRAIDGVVPPIFTVPTTAGTGSEVGRSFVVSDDKTHAKKMFFSPKFLAKRAILDPELCVGLPSQVTAATGMDALTHCVESYIAKDWHPMCEGIAIEGLRIVAKHLPKAVAYAKRIEAGEKALLTDAGHLNAREMMLNAAMMGAVAFQKDLGVTHSCAHALSTVCDLHHGLANGIMLPYAMRFNQDVAGDKMAWMAAAVGAPKHTAAGFIEWLVSFSAEMGIPKNLGAVGVKSSHLDSLVEFGFADSCHQFNPKPVTKADIKMLFTQAIG